MNRSLEAREYTTRQPHSGDNAEDVQDGFRGHGRSRLTWLWLALPCIRPQPSWRRYTDVQSSSVVQVHQVSPFVPVNAV